MTCLQARSAEIGRAQITDWSTIAPKMNMFGAVVSGRLVSTLCVCAS